MNRIFLDNKGQKYWFYVPSSNERGVGNIQNVVMASSEPWEPMGIELGEVASLQSELGNIRLDDGYYAYINPE